MTRKHYIMLANALGGELALYTEGTEAHTAVKNTIYGVAMELKLDNPNFCYEKFYKAVGMED